MFNYKETLQAMKRERASTQAEVDKLDQAISALQAVVGNAGPAKTNPTLPVQSRRQISQAQKKRRAKVKQAQHTKEKKAEKAKPKISAQGLRNIVEAQKKRWAKVRAAAKAKAVSASKPLEPSATK